MVDVAIGVEDGGILLVMDGVLEGVLDRVVTLDVAKGEGVLDKESQLEEDGEIEGVKHTVGEIVFSREVAKGETLPVRLPVGEDVREILPVRVNAFVVPIGLLVGASDLDW